MLACPRFVVTMADAALLPPCPALAGCVRAFVWRDVDADDLLRPRGGRTVVPPGPYPGIMWMVSGRARLTACAGQPRDELLAPVFLGGAHRHPFESVALEPYQSFGVVFQPAALALLCGQPLQSLTDRIVPAAPWLGPGWAGLLGEVAAAGSHPERMQRVEQALLPRWAACGPERDRWQQLALVAWQRPLQQITCGVFNWTQRHFQRRSKALTGLRAGEVQRQIRLEQALLALRDGDGGAAEVAVAHGFADQAHFTRAARAAYGAAPAELVRRLRAPGGDEDWLLRL